MDPTPLIAAIGTLLTGVLGAIALLIRELRRTPRSSHRAQRLTYLLRRIRDWCESEDLWEHFPPSLQRDINRVLEAADRAEEGGDDDEPRGRRIRD